MNNRFFSPKGKVKDLLDRRGENASDSWRLHSSWQIKRHEITSDIPAAFSQGEARLRSIKLPAIPPEFLA